MLIHLFLALQKSIKHPCYSNNINVFLHSCKETYCFRFFILIEHDVYPILRFKPYEKAYDR